MFGDGEDGVLGEVLAEGFWVYWISRSRIVCAKSVKKLNSHQYFGQGTWTNWVPSRSAGLV
jgi:hypothetical protein